MEVTTKVGCGINCIYCPQDIFIRAYNKRSNAFRMSFKVFKKCIDKIPQTENITFSGMCEPWLNPDCTRMLLYAHKKGFKTIAYTTLTGISLSDIDLIASINNVHLQVHLPSKEKYEKITVDSNYLEVLKKLSKSDIKAYFHCHTKNTLPKIKEILKNDIKYVPLHSRCGLIKTKGIEIPKRKRGIISCSWKFGPPYLKTSDFAVLLPNGEVLFCCNDFGMKHILGNLLLSDYKFLWRGEEFLKILRGMSKDEKPDIICRNCNGI